jgi:hypothetical protein
MDLNELLHAHQVAAMRASEAVEAGERQTQFEIIATYAERIRQHRKANGFPDAKNPFVSA